MEGERERVLCILAVRWPQLHRIEQPALEADREPRLGCTNAWEVSVFREGEPSVLERAGTVDSTVD